MDWIAQPQARVALATLTVLEVVLGIDNIIFISILADRVEEGRRAAARQVGLLLAMATRIALLLSIVWIMRLTQPLFSVFDHAVSWRDLILMAGGVFDEGNASGGRVASFLSVILQIAALDIVFSLDSVITAVGVAEDVGVMVLAIVIAVGVMMVSAGTISRFVNRRPTVKMLALSFLLLIGMTLVAEGVGHHVPKGYIYFAMGFSIFVELLNMQERRKGEPVDLRGPRLEENGAG